MKSTGTAAPPLRLKVALRGAVQGVGFRPFVFRLAEELRLAGWVNNSPEGVFLEVEGPRPALELFLARLETDKPANCSIQSLEASWLDPVGHRDFQIRESSAAGGKSALVLPDIATCPDCLREILDPQNRRYRYPFTNCTHCGPRFSIIEALPYDRAHTSMKSFAMCPQCQAEYDNPRDRRFHAQPNACPACGPRLELWSPTGERIFGGHRALLAAAQAIRRGRIVAVKGIGGFHLFADARNEKTVRLLRARKHREEKPFAVMFPSLESVQAVCAVSPAEARLLRSPESPIVLLKVLAPLRETPRPRERERVAGGRVRVEGEKPFIAERVRVRAGDKPSSILHPPSSISARVAPGNPNLGVLLPSNPLHHLLLAELGFPVIATSGNLSDEPICTDEHEALDRLRGIADVFLVHDRPIVRHVDDSIVRVVLDRELVLRRARGYAPLPIVLPRRPTPGARRPILAVGAHLKNSIALAVGENVFLSQHIGDLETEQAGDAFRRVIADFEKLYDAPPAIIAADLHPDYLSTRFAKEISWSAPEHGGGNGSPSPLGPSPAGAGEGGRRPGEGRGDKTILCGEGRGEGGSTPRPKFFGVQHHVAHVLSCLAENEVALPALGVAWDGTGYGPDGTIWGGEFFLVTESSVERVAHLRPFRLPGGDAAVKEPRRAALGLLFELFGDEIFARKDLPTLAAFSAAELATVKTMLKRKLNSPLTSSVGRLFDAVASLAGLRQQMRFEGQAAMELEFALADIKTDEAYPFGILNSALRTPHSAIVLDWSALVTAILSDGQNGIAIGNISAKFHQALAGAVVGVAKMVGVPRVALSGGCFQNRYLTERTVHRLRAEQFQPYWHQRVPPNDGGVALGQIVAARRQLQLK